MNLLQTIAFLQWLTEEQPLGDWQREGFELKAWIEAQGFDSGLVLAGIQELERTESLSNGLETIAAATTTHEAQTAWIEEAKTLLTQHKQLNLQAGGTAKPFASTKRDYLKTLSYEQSHTNREIAKELQEKAERIIVKQLEHNFPKLDAKAKEYQLGEFEKYAKQDFKTQSISKQQKQILHKDGFYTTDKWSCPSDNNQKNIEIGYGSREGIVDFSVYGTGSDKTYYIDYTWRNNFISAKWNQSSSWRGFEGSFSFRKETPCAYIPYWTSGYGAVEPRIQKEQNLGAKFKSAPYLELSLKLALGKKHAKLIENITSIYETLAYLQQLKYTNLSKANKILFAFSMLDLDRALNKGSFSNNKKLKRAKRIGEAFDSPDKIYQKSFEAWVYRSKDFPVYEIDSIEQVDVWSFKWGWCRTDFTYHFSVASGARKPENLVNIEKQTKVFATIQDKWQKETIIYDNINKVLSNKVQSRILIHEIEKYKETILFLAEERLSPEFKNTYLSETKKFPWLKNITAKSFGVLLWNLNHVDFASLNKKQKVILLADLYYLQRRIEPFNKKITVFYSLSKNKIALVGLWLQDLNKWTAHSSDLITIAKKQIVAGTYRNKPSKLPIYQQLINRYVIESIANQNPQLIAANDQYIAVQGKNINVTMGRYESVNPDKDAKNSYTYYFNLFNGNRYISYTLPASYNVHKFLLNWERKWFNSSQEEWMQNAYIQVKALDTWYQEMSSFPLLRKFLRLDFIRSRYFDHQISNKDLLYVYDENVIKGVPSLAKINRVLLLFVQIDKNGLTRKQKKWLSRESKELQATVLFDVLALRTSLTIFARAHKELIARMSSAAHQIEKITPDRIYQQMIDQVIINKTKLADFQYEHVYNIPGNRQVEIVKIPAGTENYDEIVISKPGQEIDGGWNDTDLLAYKQSPHNIVVEGFGGQKQITIKIPTSKQITTNILNSWTNSIVGNEITKQYKDIKDFYDHTVWFLSLAFMPRIIGNYVGRYLAKTRPIDYYSLLRISRQYKTAWKNLGHDLSYIFSIDLLNLSRRKKVALITDYYFFANYELPALKTLISGRRKSKGKELITDVYTRLNVLAKASMKVTPGEIYQKEFDKKFGIDTWKQKWRKARQTDHISVISKTKPNGSTIWRINIETPNSKNSKNKGLYVVKNSQELKVESSASYWGNDYGLSFTFQIDGNFNLTIRRRVQVTPQLTVEGSLKDGISITSNGHNVPSYKQVGKLEPQVKALEYLLGFDQNAVINAMLHTYAKRHKKIDKISKWLPSDSRLKFTLKQAESISFKNLDRRQKILLRFDYDRLAYSVSQYYYTLSQKDKDFNQEKKFYIHNLHLLVQLSDYLQTQKITPGSHGKIDNLYEHYSNYESLRAAVLYVKKDIYDIKHPKPHKRKWKQWKVWNERIYSAENLLDSLAFMAEVQNAYFNIEENALTAAYKTYIADIKAGDSSKESLQLADRAYIKSIRSSNQELLTQFKSIYTLWSRIRIEHCPELKKIQSYSENHQKIFKDAYDEMLYREAVTVQKLFHIQNDRFARKLRLEEFLFKQIAEEKVALYVIQNYNNLNQKLQSNIKRSHIARFFKDFALLEWDLIKTPYVICATTWKDIASGDGFFKSIDAGLGAGVREIKTSLNYLAKDVKDLFFLIDGILLDVAWLGQKTIFCWCKDFSWIKTFDSDIKKAMFDVEMGVVFIGRTLLELPLQLAKDVNKIAKGLVLWLNGTETLKQMLYNDVEPLVHTVERLGKFVYHIFFNPKVIAHKIHHVETLLKFMKDKKELKVVLKMEKYDRHTRKRLHKETFGIIKSPFEKFKQRHKDKYYTLKIADQNWVQNGHFTSHPDQAFAQAQLVAIHNAQVELNELSPTSDLQKAQEQIKGQLKFKESSLTPTQRAKDLSAFLQLDSKQQTHVVKKFVIHDFESYFNISSSELKYIISEDKQDLHTLVNKVGKVHLASWAAIKIENWMYSVIKRQREYVHAYAQLTNNHPKFVSDLLSLDSLSILIADVSKEQKRINSDWQLWGKKEGKMLFNSLTDFFLPGFNVVKTVSNLFGLEIPVTIINSTGKSMSLKQAKNIKNFDKHHKIGYKIFDMVMWTFFLQKHNITKLPALKWFTGHQINPLSPIAPYAKLVSEKYKADREHDLIHKNYIKYYRGFVNTYSFYLKNSTTISSILNLQVESLGQINAAIKKFDENNTISGTYKVLFQQITDYDYSHKIYTAWIHNLTKYSDTQLKYLQRDNIVLTEEAQQGDTITVADVLKSFTPEGEQQTNAKAGYAPPAPSPSPINSNNEIKQQEKEAKREDKELKQEMRNTRVNPFGLWKNYEFLHHVSKSISNKSVKEDAAAAKKKAIEDVEIKEEKVISDEAKGELAELQSESAVHVDDDIKTEMAEMDLIIETEESNVELEIDADIEILIP